MTIPIIRDKPVKTFTDFLKKYNFKEIDRETFNLLKSRRRPLRSRLGTKLYGYRMDSRLSGTTSLYFFEVSTKTYKTELKGALPMIWDDMLVLMEEGRFHTDAR